MTLLGLGPDGHTASLLPGEPVLEERRRWVAAVAHGRPEVRITMTYPVIESSRRVAFLVEGAKGADAERIRAGGSQAPAARVRPLGNSIGSSTARPPAKERENRGAAMLAWPPVLIAPSVLSADFTRPGGRSTSIL